MCPSLFLPMKTTAIDYETYYDKDCSIQNGLTNYLKHPLFDAYMVSIYSDDNFAWVGPPGEAPWEKLEGHRILAHNRSFDQPIHEHLISTGKIPDIKFGDFQCTADMSAYLGWGRSLAESLKNSHGVLMKKEVRDAMKGKQYNSISAEERRDLAQYALYDSKGCISLWDKGGSQWPDHERDLSHETTQMCQRGLPLNEERLQEGIECLENQISQAIEVIPWADIKEGALSPKEWAEYCRSEGVEPSPSMSKDDSETLKWMQEHPKQAKVLEATHLLRGSNALMKKLRTIENRTNNGRCSYGLKYFGAHTGRDSGDGGFNVQNMPRGEMYGVDLRGMIEASSEKVLLIADLAQIEARCAAYLAGETEILESARSGADWYEACARKFGMYKGPSPMSGHDPLMRQTVKTMVLGLGFGMGASKFAMVSGEEFETAQSLVRKYRASMPKLVNLWKQLERDMRRSVMDGGTYSITLPSGREMNYHNVQVKNGLSAEIIRFGKRMRLKFWSGILIENATQAFARDVFMDRVLALSKAGHQIILRVHDEVVIETDKSNAQEAAIDVQQILTTSPSWCQDLPLGTEVEIVNRYQK